MNFKETSLKDAFVIELQKREDERGFFARTFCRDEFAAHGLNTEYPQCNMSLSKDKFTLRGFHYQIDGAEEAKVVRCIRGALLDVIIDVRKGSPSYGQHLAVELSAKNYVALYVPEGFAHSFITLEENTEAFYMVSAMYSPGKERGIRWNDPAFGVQWPTDRPIVSEKDANWPDYVL
jgi:dTDP-4-dehydrorhamnose 3,5-epimerase